MVTLELEPREVYLTFLAVKNQLAGLLQYPDPLHEQHKAEYNALLGVWNEALEAATAPPKEATPTREAPTRGKGNTRAA